MQVSDAMPGAPTFRAATNTQKSDELESTSAELSFSICCNSEPKKINSFRENLIILIRLVL